MNYGTNVDSGLVLLLDVEELSLTPAMLTTIESVMIRFYIHLDQLFLVLPF